MQVLKLHFRILSLSYFDNLSRILKTTSNGNASNSRYFLATPRKYSVLKRLKQEYIPE